MKGVCLIFWMIITLVLTCTVIGMLLFVGKHISYEQGKPDIYKSTWMEIGIKLLNAVINDKK